MATGSSKKRKRSTTEDLEQLSRDVPQFFLCPICFEMLSEVYVTTCGHSFCYTCIRKHLTKSHSCPVCKCDLSSENSIHPNYTLNTMMIRYRQREANFQVQAKMSSGKVQEISGLLKTIDDEDYPEFISLFESFKKQHVEQFADEHQQVLLDFLERAAESKERELETLQSQCKAIIADIATVKEKNPPKLAAEFLANKKARVHSSFDEILADYVSVRNAEMVSDYQGQELELNTFSRHLEQFTRYLNLREVSSLNYNNPSTACSIVSSIEFDRVGDLFAVAGVTKKIKVFSYTSILENARILLHYPASELECEAKLSSVSFNPYHKTTLASADYEGCVTVWDVNTAKKKCSHYEHKKRVWSVTYNPTEPMLYASGSDDNSVKFWSANSNQSIFTLETNKNVCCVRFHPSSRFYFAYGSADHSVHYMDMRMPKEHLCQLKGHNKAVSYVEFASSDELVSASTESELKLWNVESGQCLRTFSGHLNDRHFVGLAVSNDFIACGSENNSVYVYSKDISKPMLTYMFTTLSNALLMADCSNSQKDNGKSTDFVSSVCWKKNEAVVLAGNSKGEVKILEMC